MIVRCVYASRAATSLTGSMVEDILEKSRGHNPASGITGVLCYSGDVFIQVLEGGRDEVCELYNAIVRDGRHTHVRLLVFEEIRERKFCNWTMGHVDLSKVNPGLLLKYGERAVLDPFAGSGSATMALLDELVATAAVSTRVT
ncbi:MAG: BLUF domain-containing protein [Aestuariivirga sp.]|uniref:BLUF domain-containing protein n=1 Tax=Aestuariivirga sp. TaxID=2650926 RepID=UPI0025C5E46E|nr:BLUF domain-containing protein [Aestuariivirga sp.]MCA3561534.1 BLUF domain-containing protein [Aestuariivirga sp.]